MSTSVRGDSGATSPHDEYVARLASGELVFQRCGSCSAAVFYPRVLCPECGSRSLGFEVSRGTGTVYSVTTVHGRDRTRDVVLVDLDEGFRMFSTVRGAASDEIAIGQRVSFESATEDDPPLAVFVPIGVD